MNDNNTYYSGISATGLLGVVFVTLKLLKVINWSWWWVTAPFWIPIALVVLICVVLVFYLIIKEDPYL